MKFEKTARGVRVAELDLGSLPIGTGKAASFSVVGDDTRTGIREGFLAELQKQGAARRNSLTVSGPNPAEVANSWVLYVVANIDGSETQLDFKGARATKLAGDVQSEIPIRLLNKTAIALEVSFDEAENVVWVTKFVRMDF